MYVKATEGLVQQVLGNNGPTCTVLVSPLSPSTKPLYAIFFDPDDTK